MANTRATAALKKLGVAFKTLSYDYDPAAKEIGLHAAESLAIDAKLLLKTLMVDTPEGGIVALVPSSEKLNLKSLAQAAGVKKCAIMDKADAERISGYVIGGISPLGQKKRFRTFIDGSVRDAEFVLCNGGKRGLQLRLSPADLAKAANTRFADIT